jgi:hypothetical protein
MRIKSSGVFVFGLNKKMLDSEARVDAHDYT